MGKMKLQENKRYTLNEVMQYLTESVESKAVAYCKKKGIDVDKVKNTFYKWRIRNCKYFLTLCKLYKLIIIDKKYDFSVISGINKLLIILGFSDDIDSKFTRGLDDITDPDYTDKPEEIHKRVLNFKKYSKSLSKNTIHKIDDYHYALVFNIEDLKDIKSYFNDNEQRYFVFDVKRNVQSDIFIGDYKNYEIDNINLPDKINIYAQKYSEIYKEAVEIELGNMPKENTDRYEIIPIHNFDESSEYSKYTSWCVTNDHDMYYRYTKEEYGDAMFYFCLRKDWKNVKPNDDEQERKALDDYGTSMFAVLVTEDNEIVQVTSRWNHSYGGGDNVTDLVGLSEYLGFDARDKIKYDGEENDVYNEDEKNEEMEYEMWLDSLWDTFTMEKELCDSGDFGLFVIKDDGITNGPKYNIREIYNSDAYNYYDEIKFRHNFYNYYVNNHYYSISCYTDDGWEFYYYGDNELVKIEYPYLDKVESYNLYNNIFLLMEGKFHYFCTLNERYFMPIDFSRYDLNDFEDFMEDYFEDNIIENKDVNGDNDVLYENKITEMYGCVFANEIDLSTLDMTFDEIIGAYGDLVVVKRDNFIMIIENKNKKGRTQLFRKPYVISTPNTFNGIDNEGIKINNGTDEIILKNTNDVMVFINKSTNESLNYINSLNRRMKLL